MQLQHYRGIKYPAPEDTPTAEAIQMQRRKLAASRLLSRQLAQEQARNDAVLQQLRALSDPEATGNLAFLTQSPAARNLEVSATGQSLTTTSTFTASQLPALKAVLAELRPKLSALKELGTGVGTAKAELQQERRDYIEQRTRAHIDRYGGSNADDAAALPAKSLDADEIQAMEKAAQIFNPT